MAWVEKVELHTLLGQKRIRGFSVIEACTGKKECIFLVKDIPTGWKTLTLGSKQAIEYFQRKDVNRFAVGCWGAFEDEWFLLVKDKNGIWYAYRDDNKEMFRIDNLQELDFDFVINIRSEFQKRK